MNIHLSKEQYLELFNLLETRYSDFKNKLNFYYKFALNPTQLNSRINLVKKKFKIFLNNNRCISVLERKPIKSNYKKLGRPKKTPFPQSQEEHDEHILEYFNEINDEAKEAILKHYLKLLKREDKTEENEEIRKILERKTCSFKTFAKFFYLPKSNLIRIKQKIMIIDKKKHSKEVLDIVQKIKEIEEKNHNVYGCRKIKAILFKQYGINLSYQYINRLMREFDIKINIRVKSTRLKEDKNTKVIIPNLVNRDYNQTFHENPIFATDVSYLVAPLDLKQIFNHVYLSILLDHKSKFIVSYAISKFNDEDLISSHIFGVNLPVNSTIHSDHGSVYSALNFQHNLNDRQLIQSMSRVGNSLDNREVEYFFSILKSELFYRLNKPINTYEEIVELVMDFIHFYNEERIQTCLGNLSPKQYAISNKIDYITTEKAFIR